MRKNIALILALVMILSLIPMSAFAASTNSIDRVPTVGRNANLLEDTTTPLLTITDKDSSFRNTTEFFRLELGANAEWLDIVEQLDEAVEANPDADPPVEGVEGWGAQPEIVSIRKLTARIIEVEVDLEPTLSIVIPMAVKLSGASGEQRVTVNPMDSPLTAGSYTYAIAEAGNTVVTVTKNNMLDRGPVAVGSIIIDETITGTVDGEQQIRFRLPRNFGWDQAHLEAFGGSPGIEFIGFENEDALNAGTGVVVTIGNSDRDMIVTFTAEAGERRASIIVKPYIFAKRDAAFGDVAVSMTGLRGDVESASGLVIATYQDYGYGIESDTAGDEFVTGIVDDYTAEITIEETVPNSLMRGRWVDVQLPSWVKVVAGTEITIGNDDLTITADADTSSFEFRVENATFNADDEIVIEFEFTIAGNAAEAGPRDMIVTLEGAGLDDEVSIGTAIPAISVEVVGERVVQIGLQRQLVPEIIVTENFPGALREMSNSGVIVDEDDAEDNIVFPAADGLLTITPGGLFPQSARFDGFDVEVIQGDIELGDTSSGDSMTIEIDAESEEASVIRLYNIEMTLDRTVPMGGFRIDIGGSAVLDAFNVAHEDCPPRVIRLADFFEVGTPVVDVDPDVAQVAFTVGQMAYWVDGEMMMMDVAPFISEGRIMVPVRYMEELFGMQPIWNPMARTVTVMYNNQVFEMTIGSAMLRVNGAPFMEMDAEAIIVDSRTFVPLSRFARAMNIPYVWDAATQTVTFN